MGGSVQTQVVALVLQKLRPELCVKISHKGAVQQRGREGAVVNARRLLGVVLHFLGVKSIAAVQIAADER